MPYRRCSPGTGIVLTVELAVDGTTLVVHLDAGDTTLIEDAVGEAGATVLTFTQRVTRTYDPTEGRADEPFDLGSTMGEA